MKKRLFSAIAAAMLVVPASVIAGPGPSGGYAETVDGAVVQKTANAAASATTVLAAVADAFEPDNFPADGTAIGDGETQFHTLDVDGDVDWMIITAAGGQELEAETSNLSGSNADTVLEVYDDRGYQVAYNDDGGSGLASLVTWTARYAGTFYLKARTWANGSQNHFDDQGGGLADCEYDIELRISGTGCDLDGSGDHTLIDTIQFWRSCRGGTEPDAWECDLDGSGSFNFADVLTHFRSCRGALSR
jgi:hypothetical protein